MVDSDVAIRVKNLQKSFPGVEALKGVSFSVKKGGFFGYLGPNGAGKSTTIKILTGLINKSGGEAEVTGLDVEDDYQKVRKKIGLSPQEFNFDPFLSAEEILVYSAGYFGIPKKEAEKRADELLSRFGIADKKDKTEDQLSGGMMRRLTLARALIHDPEILILDEPTAGLDVELRHELWDYLRKLNNRGKTIILTTHYIEEAERLCNRVGILNNGELIKVGNKKDIMEQMSRERLVITLSEELKSLPESLSQVEQEITLEEDNRTLKIRCKKADKNLNSILKTLYDEELSVEDIDIQKDSLEKIFLKLTKNEQEGE